MDFLISSVEARVYSSGNPTAQTPVRRTNGGSFERYAFSRIQVHGSGPSPGQGHRSIDFRKTLEGITESGPSPGEGHRP